MKKTSAQLWSLGIGQLAPDIQRILASLGSRHITHLRQAQIGRRFLKQLKIRAGPDSLAGLIILLRKAVDDGRQELLLEIGTPIYYVALMMCAHLPCCNFADEIFYLLNRFVFPFVKDEQQSICLCHNFAASAASQRLNMMALQLEDAELIGFSLSDHIKAMNKMLEGGYGWGIKYAFAPPMKMLVGRTINNEKAYQLLEFAARLRVWGWKQLNSVRKEKPLPHHLW